MSIYIDVSTREYMWRFMVELVVNDGLDESAEKEILINYNEIHR